MLMCESLNPIISGLHCWAVKLKVIIKRREVECLIPCSLTALHAVRCPVESKIIISNLFDSS